MLAKSWLESSARVTTYVTGEGNFTFYHDNMHLHTLSHISNSLPNAPS